MNSSESDYKGMTVNERLYASGKDRLFHKAVKEKDRALATSILEEVHISQECIEPILSFFGLSE